MVRCMLWSLRASLRMSNHQRKIPHHKNKLRLHLELVKLVVEAEQVVLLSLMIIYVLQKLMQLQELIA